MSRLKPFITERRLQARVRALGRKIRSDYAGRDLVLVGILKGSFIFMADLARAINLPLTCDFMRVSSYGSGTVSSGRIRMEFDLSHPVKGKDVLLVEDIVDTGFTLRYLLQTLAGRAPNSLSVCTFLDRNSRRIVQVPVNYRCFEIPDRFVDGFGLDYNQLYRNLGYVAVMKPDRG